LAAARRFESAEATLASEAMAKMVAVVNFILNLDCLELPFDAQEIRIMRRITNVERRKKTSQFTNLSLDLPTFLRMGAFIGHFRGQRKETQSSLTSLEVFVNAFHFEWIAR
jgi:hypothetical protein